ncbi:metal-sensitive transcriptional regulator [Cryobacterium frigoriphilum]|uniref:Metal-sensitive transcriptional regulator n=2 Tax=Cryobacterium frigoriphilum TaxID=1259150 RepID=A0A4R9A9G2_9MICO|nr:metal-sensitive transcriptional regulator [Cryobacterium frigoriphilum]
MSPTDVAGPAAAGIRLTIPAAAATVLGPDPEQKKILNRLKRAQGQLNAVIVAVEAGAHCKDIVTQLAAVSSALDKAGFVIVSKAMRQCLENPEQKDALTVDELEKLFLTLA